MSDPGTPFDIRRLSVRELRALGMQQIAYIKPVTVDGEAVFAIHAVRCASIGRDIHENPNRPSWTVIQVARL